MVVKFFGNTKGGSGASVDYLLNEREEAKTARTLQGDPKLTKELIRSIERKQKVCVGCLSFEETNIPEADKFKLMEEFEKTLLPDMQGRYNILWVEHTDKGRLELNFVIPRIDLETGKGLSPYYHYADAKGMRLFQQVHNLENGWSDPKDPSKERTLQGASKKIELQRDYEQLDTLLHDLVKEGAIQNRTQLIETLEASKINVTRKGQDSISVKLPESLKARKLKGGIYAEQFRSLADIKTISDRAEERVREYGERDTQRELAGAKQELEKYVQYKHGELRDRYSKPTREVGAELHQDKELDNHNLDRTREHERSDTNNVVLETSRESSSTREHHTRTTADTLQRGREPQSDTREQELTRTERNPREQNQTATSREQETQRVEHTRLQPRNDTERQEVDANERSDEGREWQKLGISREIKGESTNGNRIRTDATRRAREREEAQRFSLTATKEQPNGIYRGIAKNFKGLRERTNQNYTELQRGTSEEQSLIKELHEQRSNGVQRIAERVRAFVQGVKEYIAEKANATIKAFTEMQQKALSKEQIKQAFEKVQEKEQTHTQRRTHGHSLSR